MQYFDSFAYITILHIPSFLRLSQQSIKEVHRPFLSLPLSTARSSSWVSWYIARSSIQNFWFFVRPGDSPEAPPPSIALNRTQATLNCSAGYMCDQTLHTAIVIVIVIVFVILIAILKVILSTKNTILNDHCQVCSAAVQAGVLRNRLCRLWQELGLQGVLWRQIVKNHYERQIVKLSKRIMNNPLDRWVGMEPPQPRSNFPSRY